MIKMIILTFFVPFNLVQAYQIPEIQTDNQKPSCHLALTKVMERNGITDKELYENSREELNSRYLQIDYLSKENQLREAKQYENYREIYYFSFPIFWAISNNDIEVVKEMINSENVNLSIKNKDGVTPLILAVKLNRIEIVDLLLENSKKIKINQRDPDGFTAFILAAKLLHLEILEKLINIKEVNIHAVNLQNFSARHYLYFYFLLYTHKLRKLRHDKLTGVFESIAKINDRIANEH